MELFFQLLYNVNYFTLATIALKASVLFISTVRLSLHRRICQNRHILFFCAPSSIVLDGVTLWVRGAKASLFV